MIDNFAHIIEATEDLFADLKKMSDENMTPKDFGLAIKSHPDSILQVTARNKQRNVTDFFYSMRLDGRLKETSWLSNDIEYKRNNLSITEKIVEKLEHDYKVEKIGNNHLWRNIDKSVIIDFLNYFKVYKNDPFGISSRMPIDFIKKYAEDIDTKWDVALYSGNGTNKVIGSICFMKETRTIMLNGDRIEMPNRQVSTGTSESIALDESTRRSLGSNRRGAREKITNPLLMLHIFEVKDKKEKFTDIELAAFGASFPAKIISNTNDIRLKINTVYQSNLFRDLEDEEQADD